MLIAYLLHVAHLVTLHRSSAMGCKRGITSQVRDAVLIHSRRSSTYDHRFLPRSATIESARYGAFHGLGDALVFRPPGTRSRLSWFRTPGSAGCTWCATCDKASKALVETYGPPSRGVEADDNSFHLLDLTVYGRQEAWRTRRPAGRNNGKPTPPSSDHMTSHRPVVPPGGRAFGRPGNRQALNPIPQQLNQRLTRIVE